MLERELERSYCIALLGGTGVGKSNFSNFFSNHTLNFKVGYNLEAQTSESMLGTFIDEDGIEYGVIDNPGFFDNRGEDVERENRQKINEFLNNTTRIGTVFVVSNFNMERVDLSFLNSLKDLCHMFPHKNFWNHFGVIWTHFFAKNERVLAEKKKKFDTQFMQIIKPVLEEMDKELGIEIPTEIKMFYGDFDLDEKDNPETLNCIKKIKEFVRSNKPLYKNITEEVFDYDRKQKVGEPIILENIDTQKYEIFTLVTLEDFNDSIPPIHKKYNVIQWDEKTVHQQYSLGPEIITENDPILGEVNVKKYKIVEKLVIENEDNKGGIREEITDKVIEEGQEKEYYEVQPEQFDHEEDAGTYYTNKYYKTIKKKVYIDKDGNKRYGNSNEEIVVSSRYKQVSKPVREIPVYIPSPSPSPAPPREKKYKYVKSEERDNSAVGDLKRLGAHLAAMPTFVSNSILGIGLKIIGLPFDKNSSINVAADDLIDYGFGGKNIHEYIDENVGTREVYKKVEYYD